VPQGRGAAARCAVGVRWEAARRRMVGVRCDAAVAEKPAGEEETAGEKFEYQAEVSYRIREFGIGVHELSLVCCIHSFSMLLHFAVGLWPNSCFAINRILLVFMESAIERFCVYVAFLYALQVSRLLDLIVHSLYSHKEVFLRELVRSVIFSACTIELTCSYDQG